MTGKSTHLHLSKKWIKTKSGGSVLYMKSSAHEVQSHLCKRCAENLIKKLVSYKNLADITGLLKDKAYSDLTLIYLRNNKCVLKSDIVRTYPLYYESKSGEYFVYDHLSMNEQRSIDKESMEEFIAMGYISGSGTIYTGLNSLQAAEIISLNDEIQRTRFFYNVTDENAALIQKTDSKTEAERLNGIFMKLFRDLVKSIPDNSSIIVPLSGGHDSRLIVNYLYKVGCKNVTCYSYGTAGNKQSLISRQVAEALGYKWHFVEYTEEKWHRLHKNGEIENYFEFSFGGTSAPHLQDFLAVYELRKKGIIQKNDVIIPGHGLDILCHIIDTSEYNIDVVTAIIKRMIWKKRYYRNRKSTIQKRYRNIYEDFPHNDKFFPDHIYWQERQSKFIINSLRVYEYFGCHTRIPYWNAEVVNYWLSIPITMKLNRNFLFEMERNGMICDELRHVPYSKERIVNRSEIKSRFDLSRLKGLIPDFLRVVYLRYSKRKPVQQEALNLIYSNVVEDVAGLVVNLRRWPKSARKYFRKDLKRLPYQVNHELLIRLQTIEITLNKK